MLRASYPRVSSHPHQIGAAIVALALAPAAAQAQTATTVAGTVTSETGVPLGFASVSIPSLGLGGQTNAQGRFSFLVPSARALGRTVEVTARLVGFLPGTAQLTLTPGGSLTQNFRLTTNTLKLTEVVVTGSGTTSTRERLGVTVSSVGSDQITRSAEPNVVNALAQKAPGIEVSSQSGDPGAGSGIILRGLKTIQGDGQPLFVVDGQPIDNSVIVTDASDVGFGYSNRALDLNPADIENIDVLKGPSAAALYGLRAANGVILITTKAGRAGATRYQLSNNITLDDVNRTIPLQTIWGRGLIGVTPTCVADARCANRAWGAAIPAGTQTYDHFGELFRTGSTVDPTLQISGGDTQRTFFISGGKLSQTGVADGPNSHLDRNTFRLRATQQLTSALRIGGNVNYTDLSQRAIQKGNNLNGLLLGSLRQPPEYNPYPYQTATGQQRCWTMPDPTLPSSTCQFDGGLWVENVPRNSDAIGRTIGNIDLGYVPAEWIRFGYTLGIDQYSERRLEGLPPYSSGDAITGQLRQGTFTNRQIDHNLVATLTHQLPRGIRGTLVLGQNLNWRQFRREQVKGTGYIDPTLYTINNIVASNLTPQSYESNVNLAGYFSEGRLDFGDQLYLTGRIRADQASTLPKSERTGYFPGATLAWNVTNTFGHRDQKGVLSYLKARGSYGVAGRSPDPYQILTVYGSGPQTYAYGTGATNIGIGGLPGLHLGDNAFARGNPNLKFERTAEAEGGFDFGLFNQRIDGSISYYGQSTRDLIFDVPVPGSTGYFSALQNGARVTNKGIEVQVNTRLLEARNVSWDVGLTYARNRNQLVSLNGAQYVLLPGGFGNSAAVAGHPLGSFYFTDFARCRYDVPDAQNLQSTAAADGVNINDACRAAKAPNGAMYIDKDGFPILDPSNRVSGNPNPNWLGGIRTGLRLWRRVSFSALVDIRRGGDVWNGTRGALQSYGTSAFTAVRATCTKSRTCTGNLQTFGSGSWFPGAVTGPGAGTPVPIGENWWRVGLGNNFNGSQAQFVEDGSYTRLRELSVAYTFDGATIRRVAGLGAVDVRLAGRNLFLSTKYTGIDPETNLSGPIGAGRGQDYFNNPQTRSVVLNVTLTR